MGTRPISRIPFQENSPKQTAMERRMASVVTEPKSVSPSEIRVRIRNRSPTATRVMAKGTTPSPSRAPGKKPTNCPRFQAAVTVSRSVHRMQPASRRWSMMTRFRPGRVAYLSSILAMRADSRPHSTGAATQLRAMPPIRETSTPPSVMN